jgi:3-methyladenine DNA glycosylase AlkD
MPSVPTVNEIIFRLKSQANPVNTAGMARFGINPIGTLGISIPVLRKMAREIGHDHDLSLQLWKTGIHEARLLASMIDKPAEVTQEQMDKWTTEFDSWDICDQCCSNLYNHTPWAYPKALEWSSRPEEFVKRAGFALMAYLAVHDKKAGDEKLLQFFEALKSGATDNRNFVKKAVNWAIRQIGKRNLSLNKQAVALSIEIQKIDSPAARWIAADALRELTGEAVQNRLKNNNRGGRND